MMMASNSAGPSSPLFGLPPELRRMIWDYCFIRDLLSIEADRAWNPANQNPSLDISPDDSTDNIASPLFICKKLYHEVQEAFHSTIPVDIGDPSAARRMACSETHKKHLGLVKHLHLNIGCLYIADAPFWEAGDEGLVNEHLRNWGLLIDEWDTLGFDKLETVQINFQQWIEYALRSLRGSFYPGRFTDPEELYRLFDKISNSSLVCSGKLKRITQAGIWTTGCARAFEELIEVKAAHARINKAYDDRLRRQEAFHGLVKVGTTFHDAELRARLEANQASARSTALEEASALIRRANTLTDLELLSFMAHSLRFVLDPHDQGRLTVLRNRHMRENNGHVLNYATQVAFLRNNFSSDSKPYST
ncbi:hypothetical protein CC80DRAFT_298893 [Byssothecium circinans]|uniref:Uncharacterized protein n=1 Tax=Byssothecium circinans TaxID=147558 RepID=A0A6A5TIC0_9PLEO|nr:hypothetical protein CC80DRAFT_298893 [Byssothecium circinans]